MLSTHLRSVHGVMVAASRNKTAPMESLRLNQRLLGKHHMSYSTLAIDANASIGIIAN